MNLKSASAMGCFLLMSTSFFASDPPAALAEEANYDEAKIPPHTLPDPLVAASGAKIDTPEAWEKTRRPEILELFREHMFGHAPGRPEGMTFEAGAVESVEGNLIRQTVRVKFGPEPDAPSMYIHILLPDRRPPNYGPEPISLPIFVGMNLFDPAKNPPAIGAPWELPGVANTEEEPPHPRSQIDFDFNYASHGVATLNPAEFAPDDKEKWEQGVITYFRKKSGAAKTDSDWGAIGAWAWALSRAMDYFETDPKIDAKRVIVIGHSRMGKTALWAGAQDPRFAAVISNESGCGGAALSRRAIGETVKMINDRFPHWFCEKFKTYNDRESDMPFDQHMLIALTAPRPVYVASAQEDKWADPKGEFLAAVAAEPVWKLYGLTGLGQTEMPPVNLTVGDRVGYHIRTGKHALAVLDWNFYLEFAERVLGDHADVDPREGDAREAVVFTASNGRAWRVGPNLFIKTRDAGNKVFPDCPHPFYGDAMAYPRLSAAFENPDLLYVEVGHYEWGTYFLVDIQTGVETPVDAVPIFSPDRKRFATEVHDAMNGPSRIQIWRVDKPAPVVEWTQDTCYYTQARTLKWESPTRLTFMDCVGPEGSDKRATFAATLKEKLWELTETPSKKSGK